jgi:hypothetical protein
VVVVVGERYGPPLTKVAGGKYGPISATHVEYQTALRSHKDIVFFVRSSVFNDFLRWKKGAGKTISIRLAKAPPAKIREPLHCPTAAIQSLIERNKIARTTFPVNWSDDWKATWRLFGFLLERHLAVFGTGHSNWIDLFETVVDLKRVLRLRLDPYCVRARFDRALADGSLPFLQLIVADSTPLTRPLRTLHFHVTNIGLTPAIFDSRPVVDVTPHAAGEPTGSPPAPRQVEEDWAPRKPAVLRPNESCTLRLASLPPLADAGHGLSLSIECRTLHDLRTCDVYSLTLTASGPELHYQEKRQCPAQDFKYPRVVDNQTE